MFACILPGIFPVVLRTVLYALGEGCIRERGSLTVSFGLGLSATSTSSTGYDWKPRRASIGAGGRARNRLSSGLILTTVVLACGLCDVFPTCRRCAVRWLSALQWSQRCPDLFILRPTAIS